MVVFLVYSSFLYICFREEEKRVKKIFIILMVLCVMCPSTAHAINDFAPNSQAAVLMEASTQEILFQKNEREKMYPASTTKIMTLILIFEALNQGQCQLDDCVTASCYASSMGGSQVYLEAGETMSINDMLKSIIVASANDCCVAMAEHLYGSHEAFVRAMNQKAKQLALENTHFVNCTGLHDANHYTCALDLAKMASYLINIGKDALFSFTTLYDAYIRENESKFWLVNTNKLLKQYPGADGLKTGFTKEAGYCLVATAKRDGIRMISVVLNEKEAKVRNEESMALLDAGFSQYQSVTLYKAGDVITHLGVPNAKEKTIPVTTLNDIIIAVKKGEDTQPDYRMDLTRHEAPISKGEQVGDLVTMRENTDLQRYPVVAAGDATPYTFGEWLLEIYQSLLLK